MSNNLLNLAVRSQFYTTPNVESGRHPIMIFFLQISLGFICFRYMYSSINEFFYDIGYTYNAGHVIFMISSTSRGKPWT